MGDVKIMFFVTNYGLNTKRRPFCIEFRARSNGTNNSEDFDETQVWTFIWVSEFCLGSCILYYWQRRRHGGHAWAMKEAVMTLLLVRQRLDGPAAPAAASLLAHLPEEIWLAVCAFLRSADFMP